jgi:rhamnogalacturonyl hydrolase YesR
MPRFIRQGVAACALLAGLLVACAPARAGTMPSQGQILSDMELANDYFVAEWPTPGCSSCLPSNHPSNIWTRGTYFEGALALYRINFDPTIYTYAEGWGNFSSWALWGNDTTDVSPDDQCCGQGYIEMYQLDTTQSQRLTHITKNVNFWVGNSTVARWTYVDALHMSMPVFAKLGSLHAGILAGNATYLSKMYSYFNYTKTTLGLYNTTDHLWYRDATFITGYIAEDGTAEKCYWSRGNGWAFAALARVLDVLPTTDAHYAEYVQTFQNMAAAIAATQRTDGFWNVNLAYANDYPGPESTGTALFVYGFAWGINQGLLNINTYLPAVIAGWNALATGALHHSTGTDNGFLGYVQGTGDEPSAGQPIGYNTVPNFDDFGYGVFLLAGSQVYALNALPVVAAAPANASVTTGQAATFAVNATGNPTPTYQWQWNGANLTDNGRVVGSATANLTVNDANAEDAGNYTVVVTNLAGNATSTAASLTVSPPAFTAWAAGLGLSGANALAGAEPFADGLPNLARYAMNLGASPTAAQLPSTTTTTAGGTTDLQLQYRVRKGMATTSISPAMSTDLINWQPVPAGEITPLADDDANTARYEASVPVPAGGSIYLRLQVNSP